MKTLLKITKNKDFASYRESLSTSFDIQKFFSDETQYIETLVNILKKFKPSS